MNQKYKLPILVVGIVALLVFQAKGVMPLVYDVISSGAFLEDSPDEASQLTVSNEMTFFAFTHCNTYISDEIGSDFSIQYPEKSTNAWTMGNYQYIVNAKIELTPTNAASFSRTYACRINYNEKDNLSVADNIDNWSIDGLSGLNDL